MIDEVVLMTEDSELAAPTLPQVERAVEEALTGRGHVVVQRGDSFVQVCRGRLEWGEGGTLRRATLDRGRDFDAVARDRVARFVKNDARWSEGVAWEPVDIAATARSERRSLVLAGALLAIAFLALIRVVSLRFRWTRVVGAKGLAAAAGDAFSREWIGMIASSAAGTLVLMATWSSGRRRRSPRAGARSMGRELSAAAAIAVALSVVAGILVSIVTPGTGTVGTRFLIAAVVPALALPCAGLASVGLRQPVRGWTGLLLQAGGLALVYGLAYAAFVPA